LLPFIVFGGRPGQEIENPMAIVILGGLATSSLTNLFVLPALYLRFGGPRKDERDWRSELGSRRGGPDSPAAAESTPSAQPVTVMHGAGPATASS
jgi:hypothetical protein